MQRLRVRMEALQVDTVYVRPAIINSERYSFSG